MGGDAIAVRGLEDRVTSIAKTVTRDSDRQHADAATAAGETDPGVEQDPRTFGEICADVAAVLVLTGAPGRAGPCRREWSASSSLLSSSRHCVSPAAESRTERAFA